MIKSYQWRDIRNAVGWAVTCARLATHPADDYWVDDLALCERIANGGNVSWPKLRAARKRTSGYSLSPVDTCIKHTVRAAYHTALRSKTLAILRFAFEAALAAQRAGVPQLETERTLFSAIASDLGLAPGSDRHFAAVAALSAGNTELAREFAAEQAAEAEKSA